MTTAGGSSAQALRDHGELPGLVYAIPHVKLSTTFGFVMVNDQTSEVVEKHWWPPLRAKHPNDDPGKVSGKRADEQYMKLFKRMHTTPEECIAFSPAHLHIDILPEYQRRGWGKKLIGRAAEYLRGEKVDGVWVGIDPKNENAKKFYRKLGFEDIEAPGANMGLRFNNWKM